MTDDSACSHFRQGTVPELRPLRDARAKDAADAFTLIPKDEPNEKPPSSESMSEYENQPYAHWQLPGAAGAVPRRVRFSDMRDTGSATQDFRSSHSNLVACEAAEHASEDSPFDLCTAHELWAAMEQPRVRELTYIELGIRMPNTANAQLPANFSQLRKAVIKREFGGLSEAEQASWRSIAQARKNAVARGETDVIAVQDVQAEFAREIYDMMRARFSGAAHGQRMIVTWKACYSGAEDMGLHGFNGQISNLPLCPSWFQSSEYTAIAEPAWKAFAFRNMNQVILCELSEMPDDVSAEDLHNLRNDLQFHCEELFRLQSKSAYFNRSVFWDLVAERPHDFVAPERIPQDVTFGDPVPMREDEFCIFYRHVWRCQTRRAEVNPESRFIYQPEAINYFTALGEARALKEYWDGKKRGGSQSANGSEMSVTLLTANDTTILEAAGAEAGNDASEPDAPVLDSFVLGAAAAEAGRGTEILDAPILVAAPILNMAASDDLWDLPIAPNFDTPIADTATAEAAQDADDLDLPSLTAMPDDSFLDPIAVWRPWATAGLNAPVIEAGPDLEGDHGVLPVVPSLALVQSSMHRARCEAHVEYTASPRSDYVVVDDAAPSAPITQREQPTKRGGADLSENSPITKAAKRCHEADATARRADCM